MPYFGIDGTPITIEKRPLKGVGIPRDGLVAEYLFSGNADDTSGNGYDGTVIGATLTTDRDGNANSAYSFDGNDKIDIEPVLNDFLPQSTYSISMWVYRDGTYATVFGNLKNGGDGWQVRVDGTSYTYTTYLVGSYNKKMIASGGNFTSTTWHHLFIEYNGLHNYKIYQNNSLLNITTDTLGNATAPSTPDNVTLGFSWAHYLIGKMDDVRIYNRILTDFEREALYYE